MFDPAEIEKMVLEKIPGAEVYVKDMTGSFDHFEIRVKSSAFQGKSMIEQHRLVYQALGEAVGGPIHAVQIKTETLTS